MDSALLVVFVTIVLRRLGLLAAASGYCKVFFHRAEVYEFLKMHFWPCVSER